MFLIDIHLQSSKEDGHESNIAFSHGLVKKSEEQ